VSGLNKGFGFLVDVGRLVRVRGKDERDALTLALLERDGGREPIETPEAAEVIDVTSGRARWFWVGSEAEEACA
jgi:IMP cyclohydrolase